MPWIIQQMETDTPDSELVELWGLRIQKGLHYPACQDDYSILHGLVRRGSLWKCTIDNARLWICIIDKTHTEFKGMWLVNLSFDCDESVAFDGVANFIRQLNNLVVTPVPNSIAGCELFQFWSRFADYFGSSRETRETYTLIKHETI
jgi:hypothetical protein